MLAIKKYFAVWLLLGFTALFAEDLMQVSFPENVGIKVPVGWTAEYRQAPIVFILYAPLDGSALRTNANLVIETLPRTMKPAEYIGIALQSLKNLYSDLTVLENADGSLLIERIHNGAAIKQLIRVYIKSKKAYVLTFTAGAEQYGDYADTFSSIIKTFKY